MKIKKFRIKNYKSIIDSGDCYLSKNISILAGKNESGKTSLLEALEDFDTEKEISDEAKPILDKDAIPEIALTFEVSSTTIKNILSRMKFETEIKDGVDVEVIKYYPNIYDLSKTTKEEVLGFDQKKVVLSQKNFKKQITLIEKLEKKYSQVERDLIKFDFSDSVVLKADFAKYNNEVVARLPQISENDDREKISQYLEKVTEEVEFLFENNEVVSNFIEELKNFIPYFILFSSFEDVFPNKIPYEELADNEWVQDLGYVSDFNIDTVKSGSDMEKEMHKDDVNIRLNNDYQKFWNQDLSNLSITWDNENVTFWIKEKGVPYPPSLRSKGRQWHLSFYIKVTARAKEGVPNVLLIDEPGLFLHAQAQKDILNKLEEASKDAQIIFSTHSPYLLEADKLNRIKLVHREKEGTKVVNKIHALADKETLTPILTAIGLEMSSGISHMDKDKNVVVEGASDLYYLQAFKKILNIKNINFVFGGGAGNMAVVGTILHGWGSKVVYLYDKDQGKKDGEKNLIKNWLVTKELILAVMEKDGSIEDVFFQDDFIKHVLCDEAIEYDTSNSDYAKKSKADKVLLAKLFLEKVETEELTLDDKTIKVAKEIFKKIEKAL